MATRMKNDWADAHLSQYGTAEARTANLMAKDLRERQAARAARMAFLGKLAVVAFLLGAVAAVGLGVADYTGAVDLGIMPRKAPAVVARVAPEPSEPIAAPQRQEPAEVPAGVAAAVLTGDLSEMRRQEPAPVAAPARPVPEPVAVAPQRAAHVASLQRGIDLMRREVAETDAQLAPAKATLFMRPRTNRPRPWSAAEAVEELDLYVQDHPQINARERWELANRRSALVADCANATRRIKELTDKQASLARRIDRAQAEMDTP